MRTIWLLFASFAAVLGIALHYGPVCTPESEHWMVGGMLVKGCTAQNVEKSVAILTKPE